MSIKIPSNNVRHGIDLISLIAICDTFYSKTNKYTASLILLKKYLYFGFDCHRINNISAFRVFR